MSDDLLTLSRKAWGDLESLHVVGYFAPEVTKEYTDLGLHKRLSYFPARAAAFGEAGPGLTIATFYVFAPWLVEAALPGGVVDDHTGAAGRGPALRDGRRSRPDPRQSRRRRGPADRPVGVRGLTPQGRPLYAAHAELPWPDDDLLGLWHAATLVREHRGDGHVSVLQTAGLDPVESTVLGGIYSGTTRFLRKTRGWSDEEYDAATDRLRGRGWLDADGGLTDRGPRREAAHRGRHGPAGPRGLGAHRRGAHGPAARAGEAASARGHGLRRPRRGQPRVTRSGGGRPWRVTSAAAVRVVRWVSSARGGPRSRWPWSRWCCRSRRGATRPAGPGPARGRGRRPRPA